MGKRGVANGESEKMLMLFTRSLTGSYNTLSEPRKLSIVFIVFIDLIKKKKIRAKAPFFFSLKGRGKVPPGFQILKYSHYICEILSLRAGAIPALGESRGSGELDTNYRPLYYPFPGGAVSS